MTKRLSGRVALVTGAARGIGLAAATRLAEEGAHVLLSDIDADVLAEVTADLRKQDLTVDAVACDVANPQSVERMVAKAAGNWGRIDIVVNNAAISDDTPIEELSDEHWRHVLAINLDSALHVARAALPHLKQSPSGSIVNIASVQGIRGQPHAMAYATAKGGLVNLTRCMAVDFGPFGIRANAVAPGYIDTRMAEQKLDTPHEHKTDWFQDIYFKYGRMPLRRAGKVEDVAGPILFLASDDSLYVTGTVLVVDGGFTATY
ncbi:SDR family NAD(P)-dependent oxidoreductase [Aestuariivirga sp. YIM B02566]|uniref:SDR family oxidoreductase n=1 Tax=Taklimakanibacter albus TaxID=2800327 RepID=A0ACC5RFP3_9HYPH|nr:SDR family NAD(P)-dependent oxidoreductase [Aestuariivirga sp. YIM B02566]MBK1871223.1 SDR family oxidoreductase [Aestuariivirga sp. YIM B02566]